MTSRKPAGGFAALAEIKKTGGVLIPELKKVSLKTAGVDEDRARHLVHASEMAKADWCPRATFYRIAGRDAPAEAFVFALENIFDEGNDIHAKWQERMRQTGKLWGSWQCLACGQWRHECHEPAQGDDGAVRVAGKHDPDEAVTPLSLLEDVRAIVAEEIRIAPCRHWWRYKEVPLEVPEAGIIGHEDGAMVERGTFDGAYMVEIKSIGLGSLRIENPRLLAKYYTETADGDKLYNLDKLWRELSRPLPSHVRQANVYLWLAAQLGLPFDSVRFLYEYKFNQAVKEFTVKMSRDIVTPLLTAADSVFYDGKGLPRRKDNPPDCPAGGCKYCRAYEEASDASTARSGITGQRTAPVPAGRVRRRGEPAGGPGDHPGPVGAQARRREAAAPAQGRDRADRPAAHGPVRRRRPVAAVPEPPAGGGRGGRVQRRPGRDQD